MCWSAWAVRERLLCLHRWFANPQHYGWYIFIRVARVGFGPFSNLAAVILVKRLVIGKFKAGKRDLSQLGLLRHWLMSKLMPGGDLGKVCFSEGLQDPSLNAGDLKPALEHCERQCSDSNCTNFVLGKDCSSGIGGLCKGVIAADLMIIL